MGDTRWRSNLKGKAGTETISNFASISGTALAGNLTGNVTLTTADGGNYIQMGTSQFLIFGGLNTEASIVAIATALNASPAGSVYFSTAGDVWFLSADDNASKLAFA